jgi:predicted lipase
MLPDHPLYILKTVRDKIMEFLISDPIRKIEFYILQSDKYVNAGVLLIDQQKETLAKSAFSAANAYKKQAVTLSDTLGKQGGMLPQYISERLGKSLMKQEEVITSIAERIPQSYKEVFVGFISVIHGIQEEFSKIQ